jgi:hypothetical protein
MKTAVQINEELDKLAKDSHPPVDIIAAVVRAITRRDNDLIDVLRGLIVETIEEERYNSSPDRQED